MEEEYKRKLAILSESYKQQKNQNESLLTELQDHKLKYRQKEEENSQLIFELDNYKKRYEKLKSELTQEKEKKKSGLMDWMLTSSVKDQNSQLKEKIFLLESELESKIQENEDLHTNIFDIKFELERKIDSLDAKLTKAQLELDSNQGKMFELNQNLSNKENENVILSCTLNKLKDTLTETKEELNSKISTFQIKEKDLKEKLKLQRDIDKKINPYSEYKNQSLSYLNIKKDLTRKSDQIQHLVKIIEYLTLFEQRFLTITESIDMFNKQYIIIREVKSENSIFAPFLQCYKKISYYLNLLSFTSALSFNLLVEIKSEIINLQSIYSGTSSISIENIETVNEKIKIYISLFCGSVIESINLFCLISKFLLSKGLIETKISSNTQIFDKIHQSNSILKNHLNKNLPFLLNIKDELIKIGFSYILSFDIFTKNNKGVEFININSTFPVFNFMMLEQSLTFIVNEINKVDFLKTIEILLLNQINIGILLSILSDDETSLLVGFNSTLYESILSKDKDFYTKNLFNSQFPVLPFNKLIEIFNNYLVLYKNLIAKNNSFTNFMILERQDKGIEYREGVEIKKKGEINQRNIYEYEQAIKYLTESCENNKLLIKSKDDKIKELITEKELILIDKEKEKNSLIINNNDNTSFINQVNNLNYFDLNWCNNQINLFHLDEKSDSILKADIEMKDKAFNSLKNSFLIETKSQLSAYRQLNSLLNSLILKANINSNLTFTSLNRTDIDNGNNLETYKSKIDDLELKLKSLEEDYTTEKKNKEGYQKNVSI